jgi:hypothetical protein
MTISSTTVRNSYSGDGSTTTFSYTFKIFQDSDIQVIIRSSNGTETTKTITTHYTVTGAGNSGGGSVIFTSGNIPTSTQTVVLRRNIPQTQSIDYIANDPFPAESHEEGLDRATMAIQQLQEEVTRSLKLSKTNTMTSTEFTVGASDRANKILAFDTNGELSVTQELGTNRGSWSAGVTFNGRDIVKDGSNNNVYLCNTTHTSTGTTPISTNADVAKWDLIVDAQAATNAANNASNHASNSSNFANNSSNSANTAANHASNSSNFANNASNSASNAAASEASVSANANASANSAANASNFANNSSNSANSASNHSANSSNFANNSSNHASNSSNFANNSSNSANASSNHASNSSNHSANSSNFANASSNHSANSSNFANASSNHASNSSNHSANSSNFANTSSNHSANSSNFSNNSSNFANTASNAANAANSARDAALAAADNFDDVYLGSKATDPSLDNDGDALTAGDLYYNSTAGNLKYYTGSAWIAVTSGGITDLVQDASPQLGGALDVNTFSITSTSNGNITLQPNGTGDVVLSADTVKIGDANTDAVLTTDGTGDITISTNSGTNSGTVKIFDGVNGNIEITPNGSGVVKLDGLSYPTADGSANQVLKTDGSGVLSFATPSAGFSGATTTSSAVDITLTNTSTQVQSVEMTAADKAVILPDTTTMTTKGFPAFVIINTGVYAILLKDNGNSLLATVNPGTSAELTLIDNSTSNGVWAKEDSVINFKFSPYTTIKTGTSGSPNISSIGAEIYSGITASAISSTSAIISYHAGTSNRDVYGVVVSYSGTTITVNSETLLYSGTSTASVNSHVLMLDATTGFLFVNRASNNVVVPFTISGTTITAGTASSTFGTANPGNDFSNSLGTPIAMSSTIALVPDRNSTSTATWTLRTITHNGASAPTIGTASSSVTTTDVREPVLISKIDSTNAFMAYAVSGTSYPVARVVTISGASAPTLQTANTSSALASVNVLGLGLHKISSTEFILIGYSRSFNYTVSGTTVSYTGAANVNDLNNLTNNFLRVAKTLSLGNDALIFQADTNSLPFIYAKKIGNFVYPAQINIGFDKKFFLVWETATVQSFAIILDSSTILGITNNGITTISATIIKKT